VNAPEHSPSRLRPYRVVHLATETVRCAAFGPSIRAELLRENRRSLSLGAI